MAGRDSDGDGISDLADLCRFDASAAQSDKDGDGTGDACDACPGTPAPGIQGGCLERDRMQ
jgi:hypothetical protein